MENLSDSMDIETKLSRCGLFITTYQLPLDWSASDGFCNETEIGKPICSPLFSSASADASWKLEVFKNGFDFKTKDYICLRLHLCSTPILRTR